MLTLDLEVDFARVGIGCDAVDDLAHRDAFLLALGQKPEHDGSGQQGGVGVVEVAEIVMSGQFAAIAAVQLAEFQGGIGTTHTPGLHLGFVFVQVFLDGS